MPSFEVLLPLGAIGLYLFDSTLLLYSNELLFAQRAGRWSFAMSSALLPVGKSPFLTQHCACVSLVEQLVPVLLLSPVPIRPNG